MKLPLNCEVDYFHDFLSQTDSLELLEELMDLIQNVNYNPESIDGTKYQVNFKKVMFLEEKLIRVNAFPEKLWGPSKAFTDKMNRLKEKIEAITNHKFPVCVLIFYPDGNSGVDYHSDFSAFGDTTIIPSISLGEEREFCLREKETGSITSQVLKNGSLIIMGKHCQDRYEHSLPENSIYKNPRINLTFRKYGFD